MTDVLILGEGGQLARALRDLSWPAGFAVTAIGRRQLGVSESAAEAAAAAIAAARPDLVLNAAAYTAVDKAESEPAQAHALNADLPLAAARACAGLGIPLIHVSTDYVFDGTKTGAYLEQDAPNPLNVYGASKLAGDRNIQQSAVSHAILRTSWVFSEAGDSFPAKLLNRARGVEALRVVDDQRGCPTPAGALARAMQVAGLRLLDRDAAALGLFNYRGAAEMSWHGFAAKLVEAAVAAGLKRPALEAITSDQFPTVAKRPRNSVLDCGKITRELGIAPAAIDADVERVARAILAR
ncbi:MAG TPA: dTDP-4-dehydrorhamnose reductase [Dongiaceae bacterium]|nr:dTDP-4-dehydrorhamnose reductase [Dongiaceae bacterium]